jgi:hypothetical protein
MMAETASKFYLANEEVELTFHVEVRSVDIVDSSGISGNTSTPVPESKAQASDGASS